MATTTYDLDRTSMRFEERCDGEAVSYSRVVPQAEVGEVRSGKRRTRTLETQRRVLDSRGQDMYILGRCLDKRGAVTQKQGWVEAG